MRTQNVDCISDRGQRIYPQHPAAQVSVALDQMAQRKADGRKSWDKAGVTFTGPKACTSISLTRASANIGGRWSAPKVNNQLCSGALAKTDLPCYGTSFNGKAGSLQKVAVAIYNLGDCSGPLKLMVRVRPLEPSDATHIQRLAHASHVSR